MAFRSLNTEPLRLRAPLSHASPLPQRGHDTA